MVRIDACSRIEVWSVAYINAPQTRAKKDQGATILQIEPGGDANSYIVEVVDNA